MFNYSKQNFFYVMVVACFGFLKVNLSEKVHFREIRNKKEPHIVVWLWQNRGYTQGLCVQHRAWEGTWP